MYPWPRCTEPRRCVTHGRIGRVGRLISLLTPLAPLALLGGCSHPLVSDAPLPQQVAEVRCISECRATKDRCDADARFDYRQCQAGYGEAFREYRWCLASSFERRECGYPWWSCAENLYGYCANRAAECEAGCRSAWSGG